MALPTNTKRTPPITWEPTPRRPQFRLRSLLIAFMALSALLAFAMKIGPIWSLAIAWSALLVAAHVVGNAWGTRATAQASRQPRTFGSDESPPTVGPIEYAPVTRLNRSQGVRWPTIVLTALGAIAGGLVGAASLIVAYSGEDHYVGIALGATCAAFLGGFLCFLLSTSLGMTLRAWGEASEHHRRSQIHQRWPDSTCDQLDQKLPR